MDGYLIAFAAIFAINLLPAFGPPTWSVLVLISLSFALSGWILVPLGAVAAASGRLLLASSARRLRTRLSSRRLASLDAARRALTASRRRSVLGLGLFALSPVPSAQLFVGAGLLGTRLLALTAAFFAGRLVSYSIYVGAAGVVAGTSFGELVRESLTSPLGILAQVAMLLALVVLLRVDWSARLGIGGTGGSPGPPGSAVATESDRRATPVVRAVAGA